MHWLIYYIICRCIGVCSCIIFNAQNLRFNVTNIFILYIPSFRIKLSCANKRFGFYFHQSERQNEFLTREKNCFVHSQTTVSLFFFFRGLFHSHRGWLCRATLTRWYFQCTRVVHNSNFSKARCFLLRWLNNQEDLGL